MDEQRSDMEAMIGDMASREEEVAQSSKQGVDNIHVHALIYEEVEALRRELVLMASGREKEMEEVIVRVRVMVRVRPQCERRRLRRLKKIVS